VTRDFSINSQKSLSWFRTLRGGRVWRWLGLSFASAAATCGAAPAAPEFADGRRRAEVAAIQTEFCAASKRPSVSDASLEFQVWMDAMKRAKSAAEAADSTTAALSIALDRMGEGQGQETWNLLCEIIASRSRYMGATAPRTLQIYANFAVLLRKEGRVADARRILQLLESIVQKYPPAGARSARSVLHNLATTLSQQGYYEQAEATLLRALSKADDADVTSTQTNLAWTLEAQGKWKEAETYQREVLAVRRALGPGGRNDLAATLTNLGRNLTSQGRESEGEALIREGLELRKRLLPPGHLNVGYSLAALVQNLMQQRRYNEASPLAQELVALRLKALGLKHSETVDAYRLQAENLLNLNSLKDAFASARIALDASAGLVSREVATVNDSAKTVSRRSTANTAITLVRIAWAADDSARAFDADKVPAIVDEAFTAAQKALTSSTAEALLTANARSQVRGDSAQLVVQKYELGVARRAQLDSELADAFATGRPTEKLQAALTRVSERTAGAEAELRAASPRYFDLIRPEPASIGAVSRSLKDDEALFLMLLGNDDQSGFVWVVTRREVAWAQITGTSKSLLANINSLRRLLDPGNKSVDETGSMPSWKVAYDLYQSIFSAPQIAKVATSQEHWLLAPQGGLVSLPFSALLLSPPTAGLAPRAPATSLRGQSWLGLAKDITVVPSAAGLLALRRAPPAAAQATKPFFGLGDPYFAESRAGRLFEARSLRSVSSSDLQSLRELDPLPGTRGEIQALAKLLGAHADSYLLGKSANEPTLAKRIASNQLRDARVLAFATHGLMGFELDSIAEPALVLTPPAKATPSDDGLLTASDVARLQIRADLVLLSACNTAAGARPGMEGMTGLARSFLFAGAKSLLISHWRVADDVAPRISKRLVQIRGTAAGGTSGASAVRQAMLEVFKDTSRDHDDLRNLAHPSAWAAFAYVGFD
jgi:CHAT domain-containing protein/Tfp pilus assembly protein PilF